MDPPDLSHFPHTRTLLSFLLTSYSSSKSASSSRSSQPHGTLTASRLALSVNALNLHGDKSPKDPDTPEEDDEEEDRASRASTAPSSIDANPQDSDEDKMKRVLDLLRDESVDEDEKPEELTSLLSTILGTSDTDPHFNLESIVLSLLHRYREDINPSSQPVPPLPSAPGTPSSKPSMSRSSSFRRTFAPTTPLAMSSVRGSATPSSLSGGSASGGAYSSSVSSASSRSAPNSPFRSASPSLRPNIVGTPTHSPWSSPRPTPLTLTLNAAASEFKFSPGAADFRPSSRSGTSSPVPGNLAAPSATTPMRSPGPLGPHQAQAIWAARNSPLGTPKYAAGPTVDSFSNASSPSYFPRVLESNLNDVQNGQQIPRLPWADPDSSGESLDGDGGLGYESSTGSGLNSGANAWGGGGASPMWSNSPTSSTGAAYLHAHHAPPNHADWGGDFTSQLQQPSFSSMGGGATAAWDPFGGNEEYSSNSDDYLHHPQHQQHTHLYDESNDFTPGGTTHDHAEFSSALAGPGGLGSIGAYSMTPFDVLYSIFAGSDVSPAVLEEALVMTGFDIDEAIEYIIETQPGAGGGEQQDGPPPASAFPPLGSGPLTPTPSMPRTAIASGSRPLVVSRDSFDGFVGGNGGRGSPSGGPRWQQQRPGTPQGDAGRGVGGRVCRYYLAGNCLRSDCKFFHDVGKAVCKFWLRGHCLKGDGRCDFLHSIPPIMRTDFEARARRRSASVSQEEEVPVDSGPDLDFPSLGEAPRASNRRQQTGRVTLDPTRTRFASAVKFGQKIVPVAARAPPVAPLPTRDTIPQPRYSARLTLRPPALLPTLPTGAALSALYMRYRQSFLELGANRNKCLARAAESWKRGDGAGARKWSREAQDWQRQVAIEGRDSANRIVAERKRIMKEAVNRAEGRAGMTDDAQDRRVRGRDKGNGVILGVVSQAMLPRTERILSPDERTEIGIDLHGLDVNESVSFLGEFLLTLEREHFSGLAFVVIGEAKHSGQNDPRGQGASASRLRLEQAVSEFLSTEGWYFATFGGVVSVDVLR